MKFLRKFDHEIEKINDFKAVYKEFLDLDSRNRLSQHDISKKEECREKINMLSGEVHRYVTHAGISTSIYYSPPPAVGGMAGEIGLFENIFFLRQFDIRPQSIFDMLEKAVGNYLFLQKQHKKRVFNPFFWIGKIIRIPFNIITFAGFNGRKVEASVFGKIYKLIASIIILISAVVKILAYCNINFADIKSFILTLIQ